MRLLLIFLFFSNSLQAQVPLFFRHFTEKDGLCDPDVRCILRDREGFLWVGTTAGLNRWDGSTFRHFLPDAKLPGRTVSNEDIADIKQDSAGFIWIATRNGLNRYDPRTERFSRWQNTGRNDGSLPNSLITSLLPDQNNRLWVACDNRDLTCMDTRAGTFRTFDWKKFVETALPEKAADSYKTIYGLYRKSSDELWLGTNLGVFSFNIRTEAFAFFPLKKSLSPALPTACPEKMYFGSWDKDVLRFDACSGQWAQTRLPLPDALLGGRRLVNRIENVGDKYWVMARRGLFLLDPKTEKIEAVAPARANCFSAPTGFLSAFYAEPGGTIWLGGEHGLWQFDPQAQHIHYVGLLPENTENFYNTICRVLDSPTDGRRYALDFYKQKLYVFEKQKPARTLNLPKKAALLFEDSRGTLWVGGGKKLFQLDHKSLTIKPFALPAHLLDPSENSIFQDMTEDAAGNFWFANSHEGVLVFRPADGSWWRPGEAEAFISQSISCVFADRARRTVWIGTSDYGLFRFDEASKKFTLYRHEEAAPETSLGAYIVNAICRDGQGKIWAATDPGGLSRFDYAAPPGREFRTLGQQDGLPANQVLSLVSDRAGNLWAGTAKGLAWVGTQTLRVRSFDRRNGLETDFIDLPLCLGAGGEVISGGKFGYSWFFPDSLLAEKTDARVLLTAFRVFDKEVLDSLNVNQLHEINLTWRENFFSFEFASADFSRPEKNEFAYRLVDFDADWVYCQNRHQAAYTNVPPGNYFLEIKSGLEGRWNEPGVRLSIRIEPPFWATWWFRLLAFSVLIALIISVYRFRVGQIRREAALKTEFDQRLARVEMAALRAQMNPHFVFNCLNSINRFILVNEPDAASVYLTKFSRLIRLILDNSRADSVPLDRELEALKLYIELEAMRFDGRFEHSIETDPALQLEHIEVPPLLIQPFVENAIWHGLMHKKERGRLVVRVFQEDKTLCFVVEDDGVGRERARELKSKSATEQKSHGMQVTAERLEMIQTLYGKRASVDVEDLHSTDGSAAGTRVTVRLE